MKRHNLHTHTTYSDGKDSPEELVGMAINGGLEIIGISDHGFTDKIDSLNHITLPEYIKHLSRLKKEIGGIKIKTGLEIDVSKSFGINPQFLPFDILNQLDYVLFEYVEGIDSKEEGSGRCLMSVVSAKRRLNIPAGLAHTNFHDVFYGNERKAARLLGENDIFVEINLNFRYIPSLEHFFSRQIIEDFKKYRVKFTIGTDVHSREDSVGNVDPAMKYILERELNVHEMVA